MAPIDSVPHESENVDSYDETVSLRLRFLTPLVALIVLLVLVLAVSLFYFKADSEQDGLLNERLTRIQSVAKQFYDESIANDASALKAILATLKKDEELARIFATYDRKDLYRHTRDLYKNLNREYDITHFYFTRPDRVNLLRVHAPERHGDVIERVTTLRAAESGTVSHGVELGVLGTFTLRVVAPWYEKESGKLVGYVELGMEIDHVIERLRDIFNLEVVVVVHKRYLEREQWERGMASLGRDAEWEHYKDVVTASGNEESISLVLHDIYHNNTHKHNGSPHEYIDTVSRFDHDDASYRFISIPLEDVQGRPVAEIGMLSDVSDELNMAQQTALVAGISTMLLGGLLIVFFWRQAERVGRRIEQDEAILKKLATRDALTGLYNRRVFHHLLETELFRSIRFDHPVALLMIDIDHFKQVNDEYGHPAGDCILKEMGLRLGTMVRNVDHVSRYGGEEFTIILPETNAENSLLLAEKIRKKISDNDFPIVSNKRISITISIGVASYPADADTDKSLIAAADSAMYRAKASGRNRVCTYAPNSTRNTAGQAAQAKQTE